MSDADIGLVGLGVMGANLALNMADNGARVAVYNRTASKTDAFVEKAGPLAERIVPCKSLEELAAAIRPPRPVVIMVKAGDAVDAMIDTLEPALSDGDIVIDAGNSDFHDTRRRAAHAPDLGLQYIGLGVSGGEEGARFGPSMMAGGDKAAYDRCEAVFRSIAAKHEGQPCVAYMGPDGAGHFVKMIHNGIEYADMEMIAEVYGILRDGLGMAPAEMADIFAAWNEGPLKSYLIEITAKALATADPDTGRPMVDIILDTAGQKGTGKWTSVSALDMGVPAPTVAEAVFARCVSAVKDERVAASKILTGPEVAYQGDKDELIDAIHAALYCSKICSYAQGFQLMREAQNEYGWTLDFGSIAQIFRGGCIIRAVFLQKITEAFERDGKLANLLLDPYFKGEIDSLQAQWRKVVATAALNGVPAPCMGSALSYYDGYRSEKLPANLLQGQRDYFGAHTYERTDQPRGKFFHIDWPEPGRPQLEM
ncbi:MAG: NADP-dependent phosphogluconate dehydrogenase [Rhodobiaceae bacterium]|nr:NADP-dependent phosphogluconate dehydrogenase [Rhodobiaceae bacterium]